MTRSAARPGSFYFPIKKPRELENQFEFTVDVRAIGSSSFCDADDADRYVADGRRERICGRRPLAVDGIAVADNTPPVGG